MIGRVYFAISTLQNRLFVATDALPCSEWMTEGKRKPAVQSLQPHTQMKEEKVIRTTLVLAAPRPN